MPTAGVWLQPNPTPTRSPCAARTSSPAGLHQTSASSAGFGQCLATVFRHIWRPAKRRSPVPVAQEAMLSNHSGRTTVCEKEPGPGYRSVMRCCPASRKRTPLHCGASACHCLCGIASTDPVPQLPAGRSGHPIPNLKALVSTPFRRILGEFQLGLDGAVLSPPCSSSEVAGSSTLVFSARLPHGSHSPHSRLHCI